MTLCKVGRGKHWIEMAEGRRLNTLLGHLKAKPDSSVSSHGGGLGSQPGSYRYTLDASSEGVLTPEQRQSYEQQGFFVVKGLVPQHHLDTYRERFRQICSREVKVRYGNRGPTSFWSNHARPRKSCTLNFKGQEV